MLLSKLREPDRSCLFKLITIPFVKEYLSTAFEQKKISSLHKVYGFWSQNCSQSKEKQEKHQEMPLGKSTMLELIGTVGPSI